MKQGCLMRRVFRLGVLMSVTAVAAGCASIEQAQREVTRHEQEIRASQAQIQQQFPAPGLVRLDEPLLVAKPVPVQPVMVPREFESRITYAGLAPQSLPQILQALSGMTGLVFDVRDVISDGGDGGAGAAAQAPSGMGSALSQAQIHYRFEGRLQHLLDDLASRLNASWRWDEKTRRVVFFRYESRIFAVNLPPGAKKVTAGISITGAGDSSGGGGTGGSVSINSEMDIDPWSSLLSGVRVLLNQTGSREAAASGQAAGAAPAAGGEDESMIAGPAGYAVGNRDLAQIVVVARPDVIGRIGDLIEQTNRRFARNVLIDVRVLEMQGSTQANVGASLSAVLQRQGANSEYRIGVLGAPLPGANSSGLTISGSRGNLSIDAVVQALNQVGRVSLRNQGQIVAINGQPAPFQQANQITYLQSVSTTTTPNVGSKTSLTPGTVTVGFTANFLPTILADNRIMLQYQIQSSSLLGLRTFSSGNNQVQLPELFTQSLQQQAYLHDGDVLVLFGFEQDRSQLDAVQGVLAAGNGATQSKVTTAVVIQVRAGRV